MKTLSIAVLLVLASLPLCGQQAQLTAPDCQFSFIYNVVSNTITSTTSSSAQRLPLSQDSSAVVGYDNRQTNCTTWTLMYAADSGLSAISIELDQAPSNGDVPGSWTTWANPAPGTVQPLSTASVGSGSFFGYQPWVSVNFNSVTGTGRLYGRILGWKPQAGFDVSAPGNAVVPQGISYKHISTATNTQIKATPGTFHTLVINTSVASAITIVDTSAANCSGGVTLAVLAASAPIATYTYDAATVNGLCITTAGASDLTVSFR